MAAYTCVICNTNFNKKTADLYNGDEELYCCVTCCDIYYNNYCYEGHDEEDEYRHEEEYHDDDENQEEDDEEYCKFCKEKYTKENIFQNYCSNFCKDADEENCGYAIVNQFSSMNINK